MNDDVVWHWAYGDLILQSIVYGTEIGALCGHRFVVAGAATGTDTGHPPTGQICPRCTDKVPTDYAAARGSTK